MSELCGDSGGRSLSKAGGGILALALVLSGGLFPAAASAAPPPLSTPASSADPNAPPGGVASFLSNLQRSNYLLGDFFGLRPLLSRYGVSLAIQETSEVLGNVSGGTRRAADYDGLTQAIIQVDTQRAFGWRGGLFNISALDLHGRNLSADALASLQTASGIEGDRSLRLWEVWYDQKFLGEDRGDLRIGQMSADQEFIVSTNALYFVNTMFGWPAAPSYDLPGGGPAYPLSAPGVRLKFRPIDPLNILVAAFNGTPAPGSGDPQRIDADGLRLPVGQGALAFLEAQWVYPALGAMSYPGAGAPLGHTYKAGVYYDSERFEDEKAVLAAAGLPVTGALSPAHRGDYALYAVADQMLWRDPKQPGRSLSVFGRVVDAPQGDRNLIRLSANLGLVYHYPLGGRPDDTFGLGLGHVEVAGGISGAERMAAEVAAVSAAPTYIPVQRSETFLEATYQYQVRPWWQIQPDLQYVFTPGAGVALPSDPATRVKNEAVMGVRTNVLF